MTHRSICVRLLIVATLAVLGSAKDRPTDAPAGFDTPTLVQNAGSQSRSNGIVEPAGDRFALDQQAFETTHDASTGLGPVFNARACADCHQNPVSGAASQFTELRVGHLDRNGNFVNPTIPKRRSIFLPRRISGRCGQRSTHWATDSWRRSTMPRSRPLPQISRASAKEKFMGKRSPCRFWRRPDKRASDALDGRTSTAACSRLSRTLI